MRQRLIALGAAILAAGAGSIIFVDWDSGQLATPVGGFQFLNRDDCKISVCNTLSCRQANDVWADAGQSCDARLAACDVRITAGARAWAATNAITLPAKDYARIIFIDARCAAVDGGFAGGIALDNVGLPQFSTVAQAPAPCMRAPLDGGLNCQRSEGDGGSRFYGTGNVFDAPLAVGTGCEPVLSCSVFFGDDPDVSL